MEDPRALWDTVAPAWDRHRARMFEPTRALSEWLIDQVQPGPDRTIVEITSGAGDTSFLAAARGGTILCTDLSPAMVEAARAEAERRGLSNVTCRVMDAQQMDLPDASVDGVMSRYGVMLIPDARAALTEASRVLRPGSVLAYTVPAPPERNPWTGIIPAALTACGHRVETGDPYGPGGMFSLSTPDRNVDLLTGAGFDAIETGAMSVPQRFADFDDYWEFRLEVSAVSQRLLAPLSEQQIQEVHDVAAELADEFRLADGSIEFPSESVLVRAIRS